MIYPSSTRLLSGLIAVLLVSLCLPASRATTEGPAEVEVRADSCGPIALYLLLKAEGYDVSLSKLEFDTRDALSSGRSMLGLQKAAEAAGVGLGGVLLDKQDKAIDRPMVLFFKQGESGHFLFARPVGHTGKLVQVIEPLETPRVMDKAELLKSPGWTGLALVARQRVWYAWIGRCLLGMALIILLARALRWLRTNRSSRSPQSTSLVRQIG